MDKSRIWRGDRRMNKDKIMKALECCSNPSINYCKDCPYSKNGKFGCRDGQMFKDTLDLIIKQENEIEQLRKEVRDTDKNGTQKAFKEGYDKELVKQKAESERLKLKCAALQMRNEVGNSIKEVTNKLIADFIKCEKKQAVKEFVEKLKDKAYTNNYCQEVILKSEIDELLQEYEK